MPTRIVLIHATPIAIGPVKSAFESGWPEAEVVGILDESLSIDRARSDNLTENLTDRIKGLGEHALRTGADGILYTCSAFGRAIDDFARACPVPVLKPNEAMFERALSAGRRVAMIYTFPPAGASMEEEFHEVAKSSGAEPELVPVFAEGAIEAARAGDIEKHNRLVVDAAASLHDLDAIMLAHFSTSTAKTAVEEATNVPVLASPSAAVEKLKGLLA